MQCRVTVVQTTPVTEPRVWTLNGEWNEAVLAHETKAYILQLREDCSQQHQKRHRLNTVRNIGY